MSPSRLTIEAWPVTEAGQAEENQDTVLIYEPADPSVARYSGSLYVVVDGMGASAGALLASRYTAQRVMHSYYNDPEPDLGLRLKEAVLAANADLFAYSQQQAELVKLGATLVAAAIRGEELHVASVGDSRAYVIRDAQIQQITRDHTLVQQLIDEEAITPDEAADHPRRDVVLRSLGAEETVRVDVYDMRLRPDDALILCSDGLTRYLHQDEIATLVSSASPRSAAETLVRKVLDRGGKDNVTVIAALARDGAPAIHTETPYRWDGQPASFDAPQTLLHPHQPQAGSSDGAPAPSADVTVPAGIDVRAFLEQNAPVGASLPPEDEPEEGSTIRHQPLRREEPAPPYQSSVQPAPPYQGQTQSAPHPQPPYPTPPQGYPPDTTQAAYPPPYGMPQPQQHPQTGQRGAPRGYAGQQPPAYSAPPPGYAIDPVTGLPPVPAQGGYGQPGYQQGYPGGPAYAPRVYQPPAGPQYRQRRGIPLGRFIVAGILAVMLTAVMVVVLVNPMDWELPFGGSPAGSEGAAAADAPLTPGTTAPTGEEAQPTTQPTTEPQVAPTTGPTPTVQLQAPAGMVLIEGGAFRRGVADEEIDEWIWKCVDESTADGDPACIRNNFSDAQPVEMVTLSPFFVDITEVTNREYAACVAAEVCTAPDNQNTFYPNTDYAEHPVIYVTWFQAQDYCEFAAKRLPTEAEWEKAARWDPVTEQSFVFPWGNGFEGGRANLNESAQGGTSAVRAFAQDISPWGVIGMAGNVSEWVADWYFPGYEGLGALNPVGPTNQPLTDPLRVVRGGSFLELAAFARSGHRLSVNPSSAVDWVGFRCAMDVSGAAAPTEAPTEAAPAATPAPTAETPVP